MTEHQERRYITKWALTKGILHARVSHSLQDKGLCIVYLMSKIGNVEHTEYISYDHVFEDLSQALLKAEKMRQAKINSLQKQVNKVANLNLNSIKHED